MTEQLNTLLGMLMASQPYNPEDENNQDNSLLRQLSMLSVGAAGRARRPVNNGLGGTIGKIGGGIVGAYFGGPMGAAIGSRAGGQAGGYLQDRFT